MIAYLRNLIHLPEIFIKLSRKTAIQRRFIKTNLTPELETMRKSMDETLDEKDFQKITRYYGLAVPAIVGEAYCSLRQKQMSTSERTTLTNMGALTGLFDDFFDKTQVPENHILKLITHPYQVECNKSNEILFLSFYKKALEKSPDSELLKKYFLKVFDAQKMSKKQESEEIKTAEIEEITFIKGGISLLFYRTAFDDNIDPSEQEMLYLLGGLGQLENDLFDIFKDNVDGIKTLASTAIKIEPIRKIYTDTFRQINLTLLKTSYTKPAKKKFMRLVALVFSRGIVCLNQLQKLEDRNKGTFNVSAFTRKQLICDMEKPLNLLSAIHTYAKFTE